LILLCFASFPLWGDYLAREKSENPLEGFTEDSVTSIQYSRRNASFEVNKTGDGWSVGTRRTDQTKIKDFFDGIEKLTIEKVVSINPDRAKGFGVVKGQGILISLTKDNGDSVSVYIGFANPRGNGFYLKEINSPNVFLVEGDLNTLLPVSVEDWMDVTIVDIPFDSIDKITVFSSVQFILQKNDGGSFSKVLWGQKEDLDSTTNLVLKTLFSPLEGQRFLTEEELVEFDNNYYKHSILLEDSEGENLGKIIVLGRGSSEYWVQKEGSDDAFYLRGLSTIFSL